MQTQTQIDIKPGQVFTVQDDRRAGEKYHVRRIHDTPEGRMFIANTEKKGVVSDISEGFLEISLKGFIDRGMLTILNHCQSCPDTATGVYCEACQAVHTGERKRK